MNGGGNPKYRGQQNPADRQLHEHLVKGEGVHRGVAGRRTEVVGDQQAMVEPQGENSVCPVVGPRRSRASRRRRFWRSPRWRPVQLLLPASSSWMPLLSTHESKIGHV